MAADHTTEPAAGQMWLPTRRYTRQKPKTVLEVGDDPEFFGGAYVLTDRGKEALSFFLRWAKRYEAKVVNHG